MTTRGRYAPSPTGELHLGNARTALAAWLGARSGTRTGPVKEAPGAAGYEADSPRAVGRPAVGCFLMRVEDLDPPRVIPGAEARILEDLAWLGLDWDEGPDVGGPRGPYRQSERGGFYRDALGQLAAEGLVYACRCSRARVRGLSSAPHGPGTEGPVYPGACRDLGLPLDLDAGPSPAGGLPAIRLRVPEGIVRFDDAIAGPTEQRVDAEVGDFILRRADGLYTYQLAVVVDDGAMGVTQVVRGADLLHSTARQIVLQRALGLATPEYAHVPLVLSAGGERLAKRDRAAAVRALREAGARPEAMVGMLAHSLGLCEAPEPVAPRDLVAGFSWDRVARAPWRFEAGP